MLNRYIRQGLDFVHNKYIRIEHPSHNIVSDKLYCLNEKVVIPKTSDEDPLLRSM
jgi:hypothetical protein